MQNVVSRPWCQAPSVSALFDTLAAGMLDGPLAESAFAMRNDWNGNPYDPPPAEQPGVYAWGEAHLQYACVLQYEATGDPRYLDRVVQRFRRLLALRDDRTSRRDVLRGRVLPAWGSTLFSGGRYSCFIVHAGMLAYPTACLVRLAAADPALAARYAAEVAEFTPALRETVDAFDHEWHDGPGADEGYYTDTALDGRHLPLNQQNCLGRVMLQLAEAGCPAYRERVTRLARYLRRRITVRPDGAFQWQYYPPVEPPFAATPAEDISHAAMNVEFMVLCRQHGLEFTDEDLHGLARTFLQVIRRPDGRIAECIDGSGEPDRYADVIGYWGNLAGRHPDVGAVIRDHALHRDPPMTGPMALLTLAVLARHGLLS